MKRFLALLMTLMLVLSLAACGDKPAEGGGEAPAEGTETTETGDAGGDFKIGIMTGTVSQNEEEYRAAEEVQKKYGEDKVTVMTYPDKFMDEQDTTIANIMALASDPDIKAIVICQAVPGVSAGIKKAKEVRDDILFIGATPGEDPPMISEAADVVMAVDELAMGRTVMEQAQKMGAKVFVHYSFPRHMSYALLAARRDLLRENAEKMGIEFVDATAPDPTGDAGVTGAQQFILEDVPKMVAKYGKDTAFFSTNCSMQIPLIKSVVETGALYPQPCCPSPFHGFPSALDVPIPDDKKGDIPYMVEQVSTILKEKGMEGRLSTWPVPANMMFVRAGAEYGIAYAKGELKNKLDVEALKKYMEEDAKTEVQIATLEEGGKNYDNYFMVLVDFLNF